MMYEEDPIKILIGKTLTKITVSENNAEIRFETDDGEKYLMYHNQDCCESVSIDEIIGDLDDLIGIPILDAREENNIDKPQRDKYDESFTWTFYIIATIKGTVTLRWYGSSNGYYSESVDFTQIEKEN